MVLEVKELRTSFFTSRGEVHAVDRVSFGVERGKTLGIVGESGCGKSVTSLSILRLIPNPPGKILGGEILYEGKDLLKLSEAEIRKIRGNQISMIFQEPMTSLNPVFTIGNQICETLRLHQGLSKKDARLRAIELLKIVGIPSPERRVDDYPHQLSGGMRQRVMIAMALSCRPSVLIADEPTTALDVTIQAQILDLLRGLQKEFGMALILITHDLGVVAEMADDVLVMYAGRVVEYGSVKEIFSNPKMPYTQGLLRSIPKLERDASGKLARSRLETIPGIVPDLARLPEGCRFKERCSHAVDACGTSEPELRKVAMQHGVKGVHQVRCIKDL